MPISAYVGEMLDTLSDLVSYFPYSSFDGYGNESYGSAVINIPAHVSYRTEMVRDNEGESATSYATIIIPPPTYVMNYPTQANPTLSGQVTTPAVAARDAFTTPDGIQRKVIKIEVFVDDLGLQHHQTVRLTSGAT